MSQALRVAIREIREKRLVFAAAFVAGIFPLFFAPLFSAPSADTINAGALTVAATFAMAGAILIGSTIVVQDLAEHRMSFDLVRPVPTIAIWAGRNLAASAIVLGSGVAALLPATLLGHGLIDLSRRSGEWVDPAAITVFGFAVLSLTGIAHIAGLDFRSRSHWSLVDILGIPLTIAAACVVWIPIARAGAERLVTTAVIAFLGWTVVAVFVASGIGFVRGRAILADVQRWTAITLGTLIGFASLVAILYGAWVRTPSPDDLTQSYSQAISARSPLIAVAGTSTGRMDYYAFLLLDIDSGEWARFEMPHYSSRPAVSDDGALVAWQERSRSGKGESRLVIASMTGGNVVEATAVPLTKPGGAIAFSPDSKRIAFIEGTTLRISELTSGRSVASLRISDDVSRANLIIWIDRDRIRLYAGPTSGETEPTIRIAEADVSVQSITRIGWCPAFRAEIDGGAERLLAMGRRAGRIEVSDARSGEGIATLGTSANWQSATFLADGGIAAAEIRDGHAVLSLFDHSIALVRDIDLGPAQRVSVGAEPVEGKLTVGISSRSTLRGAADFAAGWNLLLIDLTTGRLTRLSDQAYPAAALFWGVVEVARPGSGRSRLVHGSGGVAMRVDHAGTSLSPLIGAD